MTVDALLLKKSHQAFVAGGGGRASDARNPAALRALETDLLGIGYLLQRELRDALLSLPPDALGRTGQFLFDTLAEQLGANRPFVPLFRNFPASTPKDTYALYVERVAIWLYQAPDQPCLLCGGAGTVHAVKPCAHLVCRRCFDGGDYSACPICRERISLDDPFLLPTPPRQPSHYRYRGPLTLLSLGADRDASARALFSRLVKRATVLRPDEIEIVETLVAEYGLGVLPWLPERIAVKETLAVVFATLLRYDTDPKSDILGAAAPFLKTATDVLRVLAAWLGGNPDLTEKLPLASFPRRLRRATIHFLESFSLLNLTEDLHRHPGLWKAIAGQLHVFERWRQHPKVTLAFAALRKTPLDGDLGRAAAELAARHPGSFQLGTHIRFRSWAGNVESALARNDIQSALPWLGQRPGELMRRFDHVVRTVVAHPERASLEVAFGATVDAVVPKASSPLLVMLTAHLRCRHQPFPRRVFFPKGEASHAWGTADLRPLLPGDTIGPYVARFEAELVRRAEKLPPFPQAILDEGLQDLLVPFAEKTASRSPVAVPRGSTLAVPDGKRLRFFVHWTEPAGQQVDLDLSVALYDDKWWLTDLCDFTNMRLADDSAIHSGDITSGPSLGGAEFLDVHLDKLLARGVRWAVPVIFSYNSVSFDRMEDAFAGFLVLDGEEQPERHFDARAVEQRFDLQGKAKIALPLVIDLVERRLRWIDVKLPSLFAGLDDELVPPGSEGYALRFRHTNADEVRRLASGDLLSSLKA